MRWNLSLLLLLPLAACLTPLEPGQPLPRRGDEISACGRLFHTGTRVILWNDPGGYDAYRVEPRFPDEMDAAALAAYETKANYHSLRGNLSPEMRREVMAGGWTLDHLRQCVDLFVLHYDACGTSRQCFKVLQDRRHLSVHFMLDLDGTIYQTLDLKERAWHAAEANDRSVGIEIAQIGAYENPQDEHLLEWYATDDVGLRVVIPDRLREGGIPSNGFIPRPATGERLSGPVHGKTYHQYDFTDEQYQALIRLTAALHRIFPRITLDVPRDEEGAILTRALTRPEFEQFSGLLGHSHVTARKIDPGPAFGWERLLRETRILLVDE